MGPCVRRDDTLDFFAHETPNAIPLRSPLEAIAAVSARNLDRRWGAELLCLAQHRSLQMSGNIAFALLMIGSIGSIHLAGRIAERRGRRFRTWAGIAAIIGPLALPLVFLFPNLHRENGD